MNLKNRAIVLGITGGIAAYKAADLCSRLVKAGAVVDVVMTEAAAEFVTPLTFQSLTHRPVAKDMFALLRDTDIAHVSLAARADLLLIAPLTANTLAKLANGLADNMLTATALATRGPLLLAPAMETGMWDNPLTQANLARLQEMRDVTVVGPGEGRLASGAIGAGRMAEPAEIVDAARWVLGRDGDMAGRQVVVSAGGTQEPLDPVRYITNRSSGKMGYALAEAARDRGAGVTLVSAPTALPAPYGVRLVLVRTAAEMCDAVLAAIPQADALVMAAAVTDYRPATAAGHKIKKGGDELVLPLARTPDTLMEVARWRESELGERRLVVVGFAAETEELLANAQAKLERKRLDLIVANDVSAADSGFAVDSNRVTLLDAAGGVEAWPLLSKVEVAHRLWDRVGRVWHKGFASNPSPRC